MSQITLVKGTKAGIDITPVKDGQVLIDTENRSFYIDTNVNGSLSRLTLLREPFIGTQAEWDALTDAQKESYVGTTVIITDDYVHANDDFIPATASTDGQAGLVPQPHAGDNVKVLYGDGTWKQAPYFTVSGESATFHAN